MANSLKIQSLKSLREEMVAVARGERPAPPDANVRSFNSLETVARLLTKENRKLLSLIRDSNPKSVAELAELSGRSQPNLTRTLNKLQAVGFVVMSLDGRQKAPRVALQKLTVEIDPYSEIDTLRFVPLKKKLGQRVEAV
ncbi:MAG: MarR family transcriptional regulator [Terracidiphilus sp.]